MSELQEPQSSVTPIAAPRLPRPAAIKRQLSRFLDFSDGKALLLNNAEWLTQLAYIPFLRDIRRYFSVNRMIKAESYKMRLDSEEGLSFIEFNYMVLQAYDFLELMRRHDCRLQMGGRDQWGNIVAGVDLIRRLQHQSACRDHLPVDHDHRRRKDGQDRQGCAVWLDAARTSPYDYYQYWINTDDRDVARFLALFTFLPMAEIRAVAAMQGVELNLAKTILAFEATQLAHGHGEALKALQIMLPRNITLPKCVDSAASRSYDGRRLVNLHKLIHNRIWIRLVTWSGRIMATW